MTNTVQQENPVLLFPAFAANDQEAAYKVYLTLIRAKKEEGTLTDEEEISLLTKAAEIQKRLREHQAAQMVQ